MDCFFATVAVLEEPSLKGHPVAVAHGNEKSLTSEISSCNYIARSFGVKAGMFVQTAVKLCPHLVLRPYNFPKYASIMENVIEILLQANPEDMVVLSVDEAILQFRTKSLEEIITLITNLRQQVEMTTQGCTVSVGIGGSILLAKLATRKAKPNGFSTLVSVEEGAAYLTSLPVRTLPNVGYATAERLNQMGVETVQSLRNLSKSTLTSTFGDKQGTWLYFSSRGQDLPSHTLSFLRHSTPKSLSSCINFGIRASEEDLAQGEALIQNYLRQLVDDIETKLKDAKVSTTKVTLKLKVRNQVGETMKFLGHGLCVDQSKTSTLKTPTHDSKVLLPVVLTLWAQSKVKPSDVRGLGVHVTALGSAKNSAMLSSSSSSPLEGRKNTLFRYLQNSSKKRRRRRSQSQGSSIHLSPGTATPTHTVAAATQSSHLTVLHTTTTPLHSTTTTSSCSSPHSPIIVSPSPPSSSTQAKETTAVTTTTATVTHVQEGSSSRYLPLPLLPGEISLVSSALASPSAAEAFQRLLRQYVRRDLVELVQWLQALVKKSTEKATPGDSSPPLVENNTSGGGSSNDKADVVIDTVSRAEDDTLVLERVISLTQREVEAHCGQGRKLQLSL